MSCIKNCAKNNIYVVLVLLLRQARQKNRVETAASSKTEKSDGSEWWVFILLQMMCNQNKNSIGLIGSSQGFAKCAQILLATKIGGATAIQKLWVKWTMGSWSPVGTGIVLVIANFRYSVWRDPICIQCRISFLIWPLRVIRPIRLIRPSVLGTYLQFQV